MDTLQSLALLCLVSASFAFPAGFGTMDFTGKFRSAKAPLHTPSVGFRPELIAQPAVGFRPELIAQPAVGVRSRPVTVRASVPTTIVQGLRPISQVPAGGVVVSRPVARPGNVFLDGAMDGAMDGAGDQFVVVGGGGTGVVGNGGLSSYAGDVDRVVLARGGAGLGGNVRVVPARGNVLLPNTVAPVNGRLLSVGGGGGVRVVPNAAEFQAYAGGDFAISDSTINVGSPSPMAGLNGNLAASNFGVGADVDIVALGNGQVAIKVSRDTPDFRVIRRVVGPMNYPGSVSTQNVIIAGDSTDSP